MLSSTWGTTFLFYSRDCSNTETEIQNMKYPNTSQHNTSDKNAFSSHHKKSNAHQECYHQHNTDFCSPCHSSAGNVVLQIVLIQSGSFEPLVQSIGASGKTESRKHQKWKRRQYRHNRSYRPQNNTDTP